MCIEMSQAQTTLSYSYVNGSGENGKIGKGEKPKRRKMGNFPDPSKATAPPVCEGTLPSLRTV
jgi:hypothetical protein